MGERQPHLSLRKRMRRENFRETRREQHHRSEGDVRIAGVIIDCVTISALTTDQSYARVPDGSKTWQITNSS
jgi:hypothetical protein